MTSVYWFKSVIVAVRQTLSLKSLKDLNFKMFMINHFFTKSLRVKIRISESFKCEIDYHCSNPAKPICKDLSVCLDEWD